MIGWLWVLLLWGFLAHISRVTRTRNINPDIKQVVLARLDGGFSCTELQNDLIVAFDEI